MRWILFLAVICFACKPPVINLFVKEGIIDWNRNTTADAVVIGTYLSMEHVRNRTVEDQVHCGPHDIILHNSNHTHIVYYAYRVIGRSICYSKKKLYVVSQKSTAVKLYIPHKIFRQEN